MNSSIPPEQRPELIDVEGGEPLAGSGFETEEPDTRFGSDLLEAEEA